MFRPHSPRITRQHEAENSQEMDPTPRLRDLEASMFNLHVTWENMATALRECEATLRHLPDFEKQQVALWLKVDSAYLASSIAPPSRAVPPFVREMRASLPHRTPTRESFWRRLGQLGSDLYDEAWQGEHTA